MDNNKLYTSPQEKANLFNNHFIKKSKPPDIKPNLPVFTYLTDQRIDMIQVSVPATEEIIEDLDISKANGPDNISNKLIKLICRSISAPLTKLCNLSFSLGEFPDIWKEANVNPLHKDDDRQIKTNYRPISLLSNFSKILEKHAFIAIYNYCITHNLLTWKNSGYKRMDSTINRLIYISHKIYDFYFAGCFCHV